MGRMIKNAVPRTASYAIGLPIGTSSIGPDPVTLGQTRWNTSTSKFEYYNGTMWYAVAHEGATTVVKDSLGPGDNTNSVFGPMTYSYNPGQEAQVIAVVNNVIQEPGVGFTFMGNTSIKFTSVPTTSAPIYVLHNYASTSAA